MLTEQEQRHVYYDRDLKIEAYNLSGIVQKFPNHFHEYYVIGFVEGGKRHLWCKGKEYDVTSKDLIIFNPRDNHFCAPMNGEILDYRALNIQSDVMLQVVKTITGKEYAPYFTENVVYQSELSYAVGNVYDAILHHANKKVKESAFHDLIKQLLVNCVTNEQQQPQIDPRIQILCGYMEQHFAENITLDDMLKMVNYGKSYLLRTFTKQVGVSPYRYLQTIRLDKAKRFLELGVAPVEAAMMAGFSDQSHFTNFFKEFIGLTPKQYQRIFTDNSDVEEWESEE